MVSNKAIPTSAIIIKIMRIFSYHMNTWRRPRWILYTKCAEMKFFGSKGCWGHPWAIRFFSTRLRFGFFIRDRSRSLASEMTHFLGFLTLENDLFAEEDRKITKTITEKYRRYSILIETVNTPRDSAYEILSPVWGDDGHNNLNHMIRGIINSM